MNTEDTNILETARRIKGKNYNGVLSTQIRKKPDSVKKKTYNYTSNNDYEEVAGVRWYRNYKSKKDCKKYDLYGVERERKNKGMLDYYDRSILDDHLIVQLSAEKDIRYASFKTIDDFLDHEAGFTLENRGFFESIRGYMAQKPHFDI